MRLLIDRLLRDGLISKEQLDDAMAKQVGAKEPLQELFVEMGFITEDTLMKVSSEVFGMPMTDIKDEKLDPDAVKFLPYEKAKKYGIFPVRKEGGCLVVATSDPQDVLAMDDVSIITGLRIKPLLSRRSDIKRFMEEYYDSDESIYDLLKNMVKEPEIKILKEEVSGEGTVDVGSLNVENAPVVRLVNLIFSDAMDSRASDIHIEPQDEYTEVRYRIDGDLKRIMKMPARIHPGLSTRIKIMSDLKVAEKQKPQDGRTAISVNGKTVDVRVSIIPTFYGEKLVLRLLDKDASEKDLNDVGFTPDELMVFKGAVKSPQGMVLVTGPTGSGKTSTLCAALCEINEESKNIITIEDPIEYLLDGINQIQVNPARNVTFASGLRSILRQDPNVVLVGEIRDKETAEIAFRASQTGHLVFSTLHTNNAVSTITRLIDIGLEPFIIGSSLNLIVAQRLVRVICPGCKEEYEPERAILGKFRHYMDKYGISVFYRGRGCERCSFSGYLGRTAIFEILAVNEKIRTLISSGSPENEIYRAAVENGLRSLADSGAKKVKEGITNFEELGKIVEISDIDAEEHPVKMPGEKDLSPEREKPLILIADDEKDIRFILAKRLEAEGYDVVQAENGKEGVETALRQKPDLIITDLMMPVMDGVSATRVLRSRLETASIPVVMLTAKGDKESELEGFDAGADDYITKPFDKDKLLARVKMLLKRKGR